MNISAGARGVVLFAHGSGSSRHSPRNQFVARTIREAGVGTMLFDLLTAEEEAVDIHTRHLRFDIGLLADRLIDATDWIKGEFDYLSVGYFGSSTGGGAALVAAAEVGDRVGAVVSRGGRPDLAGDALPKVKSPTLLIVGGLDYQVIEMNEAAFARMRCEKELKIVPGATHLFEEPGTLEEVARLAADWFGRHLHSVETQ
ncbi:MAG: hydrolase [Acidobacteria bacterium]|nr:MAG: hydrolase [Acidobacteriota bacterium]